MSLRKSFAAGLFVSLSLAASAGWAQVGGVIPQTTAARHGLTRAWFTQIEVDRAIGRVEHITLNRDLLIAQTNKAIVHAIDAETGRTLWIQQIGERNLINMAPAANEKFVAVINGTTLYVVDRGTGVLKWQRRLNAVPGAGAALSETHVFVPMHDGMIQGWALDNEKNKIPWIYKSAGHTLIQPIVTSTTISWTTDRGYFYVAEHGEKMRIRYRVETRDSIDSQPAYWTPYLYAGSTDGYVYAVNEKTGDSAWKFSTGSPVGQPPVAINGKVYVVPDDAGMFCLSGDTGKQEWLAAGPRQFLAASPTRIYAVDAINRLLTLDAKSGARIGIMPIDGLNMRLINSQSDRIYLGTKTGLLQCLRETELKQPLAYIPPTANLKGDGVAAEKPKPVLKKPADDAEAEEPAEEEAMDAPADDATAEEPAEEAMEAPAEEESPFE